MPTWYENTLAGALKGIQHELVLGEASEGDLRAIRQCAAMAGDALADYRRDLADGTTRQGRPKILDEHDRAVEGVRAVLQRFVSRGYIEDDALREEAVALLSTPNAGAEAAEFLRKHVGAIATNASLHAANEHVQKSIHEAYLEAEYRLAALDQLDWRWCDKAWETGHDSDDDLQAIRDDGGYRAILASSEKQAAWQDLLDHVLNDRLLQVVEQVVGRKSFDELRELSRQGVSLGYLDGHGHFRIVPKTVGVGVNVVGLTYQLSAGPRVRTATGWEAPVMLEVEDRMAVDGWRMGMYLRTLLEEAWKRHQQDAANKIERGIREGRSALDPTNHRYDAGYADALESVLLCLVDRGMRPEALDEVRQMALDAFEDNAPDSEDPAADGAPAPTP